MYHQVYHSNSSLYQQCTYMFCMILTRNSNYFPIQHSTIHPSKQSTVLCRAQIQSVYIQNAVSLAFKDSVMGPAVCCWPQPLTSGYDPRQVHMRSLVKWWWDRLFLKHFRFYPVNKHNSYQKDKQAKPVDLLSTALLEDGQWFLSASIHEAINRYINFENILEVT